MSTKQLLNRYFKFMEGFRLSLTINSLLGIINVIISLTFIWTSKHLIDIATKSTEGNLVFFAIIMGSCLIAQLLISAFRGRQAVLNEISMRNSTLSNLFTLQMNSCLLEREKIHSGDIINRLDNDVSTITDSICSTLPSIVITAIQLVAALLFLASMNVGLAIALICIMPIAIVISKTHIKRMRSLNRNIRDCDSEIQTHIQENLQNRTVIATLEHTTKSTEDLNHLQKKLHNKSKERQNITFFSKVFIQLGFSVGYITTFLWGIYELNSGAITFGTMGAFLQLVGYIQRPILDLSKEIPNTIRVLTSVERIIELEQIPTEIQGDKIKLDGKVGVVFENVSYHYPNNGNDTLNNLSHKFKPGSLTAIIGKTGAGKSTLFKLILGLFYPTQGKVSLYNETSKVSASPLTRSNIIYVPQGNTLLSGTIRDNLLIGNPSATDEQIKEALYTAVADFVYELPNGLDTECSETGGGISEGQAQRIAIARGLLRSGNIMLLDEPSSSLDAKTEQALLERLQTKVHNKTLLLITHRDAIAQLCNETIKL